MTAPLLDRGYFESLTRRVFAGRKAGEHFFVGYSAEASEFIRLNAARVRQAGLVEDAELSVTLVLEGAPVAGSPGPALRTASSSTTLTGLSYVDQERLDRIVADLRREVPELPVDPYAQLPRALGSSEQNAPGALPAAADAADAILEPARGADIAGIFAAGTIVRAMANTAGQLHWFSTQNYSLDYSLYTPSQRALKGTFAGNRWDAAAYRAEIDASRRKLELLEHPAKRVPRGTYRAFLEPAAYSDLVEMISSWGGVSEASMRQGDSPLRLMREGAEPAPRRFSPLFTLTEDFTGGRVPRFNAEGELAPETLVLVDQGRLVSSLVSSRTASEYGTPANGAEEYESMRAPAVAPGRMPRAEALKRLGTGLYLSNLHYLNWSDQPGGRVTGMTRYACFWVENGEIVAPIENLRFDDSIFSLFGSALEELTAETAFLPDVHTYDQRSLGGTVCPGALLKEMAFTL